MRASVEVRKAHSGYVAELTAQLRLYQGIRFADQPRLFEGGHADTSPPVFTAKEVYRNVVVRPGADAVERAGLRSRLPLGEDHRWLGSMKSSQALVWSVFANLAAYGKLHLLADLRDDDGRQLFAPDLLSADRMQLEYRVDYLGEPRPTSLDVLFSGGAYRVAVEGKLTESEIGRCSRPSLRAASDPNYATDYCDGRYERQRGREERCSLSEIGVAYWRHVPSLFDWPADQGIDPCPLRDTYQLVRNLLAACVRPDGRADPAFGHAVLIYDARNPQFGPGGAGHQACRQVRAALKDRSLLRLCTWQSVAAVVEADAGTAWLSRELQLKYGLGD